MTKNRTTKVMAISATFDDEVSVRYRPIQTEKDGYCFDAAATMLRRVAAVGNANGCKISGIREYESESLKELKAKMREEYQGKKLSFRRIPYPSKDDIEGLRSQNLGTQFQELVSRL